METGFKYYLKQIAKYFAQGLLYTIPIALTGYVIFKLFTFIDGILPIEIPGLGLLILLIIITIIGFLGTTIIARPIEYYINKLLERAPLIKTIYTSISDLLSAFVGDKKKFDEPVLVKVNKESEIYKLGFITTTDLSALNIDNTKVAVYLPHSYNFSGNLFIVPTENITSLHAKSADVMKFIVSGGVTEIEK